MKDEIQAELEMLGFDGWNIEIRANPASIQFGGDNLPPAGPDIVVAAKGGRSTSVNKIGTPSTIAKELAKQIKSTGSY